MASYNISVIVCLVFLLSLQAPKFAWSRVPPELVKQFTANQAANYNQVEEVLATKLASSRPVRPSVQRLRRFPGNQTNNPRVRIAENNGQRLLHAVINVTDLNRTIEFYQVCFGMQLLSQVDRPDRNYSYALVSFGPHQSNFVLRLVYNYGVDTIDIGTGFGHFGVLSRDAYQTVETVIANGGMVVIPPAPSGDGSVTFAFVMDFNGYIFEITQTEPTPESIDHVNFLVTDMNRTIEFYQRALGMTLLRLYDAPGQFSIATIGYGQMFQTTLIELTFNYGTTSYTKGNGYSHVAISTNDVYRSARRVRNVSRELGGGIVRPPGPLNNNVNIASSLDPEGFEFLLVDNEDINATVDFM